jgi:hypothetical protein
MSGVCMLLCAPPRCSVHIVNFNMIIDLFICKATTRRVFAGRRLHAPASEVTGAWTYLTILELADHALFKMGHL